MRIRQKVLVEGIGGPEGPVWIDGKVFFVSGQSHCVLRWDGQSTTVIHREEGLGHNGLSITRRGSLLVACIGGDLLLEITQEGEEIRRWTCDSNGKPLGRVNDVAVSDDGGAYATCTGEFADPPGAILGRVLFLAPDSSRWVQVADMLSFANGLALSPERDILYVGETVGNSIKKFRINPNGTLQGRSHFAMLNWFDPQPRGIWWFGPDGLKVDSGGRLFVAQYKGGKILRISPDGKSCDLLPVDYGDGVTNLCFGPTEDILYVTVIKDSTDPKEPGALIEMRLG